MAYLKWLFRGLCVLLSLCATIWPIYLFNLNEDALEVELKDLHSSKDTIYPGIRLCFARTALNQYEKPSRNMLSTKSPLQDDQSPARLRIDHYIRNIVIIHANKTRPQFTRAGMKFQQFRLIQRKGNFTHIVLRRFQSYECLDIGIPFKENVGIQSVSVNIKKDIFKKDAVPTRNEIMSGTSRLTIGMSSNGNSFRLPNQNAGDLMFNNHLKDNCSSLVFDVKGMEIFNRRKTPSFSCIGYDSRGMFKFATRSIKKLGCMPASLEMPVNLPGCQGNKTKVAVNKLLAALQQFSAYPCRSIRDLKIEYSFDDLKNTCEIPNETLQITARFDKFLFKEIKVVRAYTIGNLVSSIAVIISIFYGVSFIDIADVSEKASKARKSIKRTFSKRQSKRRKSLILIDQALDKLRTEVKELNGKFENTKGDIALTNNQILDTIRNEGREKIERLCDEIGELNAKFENAKDAIALTNNESLDTVRNEGRERIEGLRNEIGRLNGKLENETDAIALTNNQTLDTIRNEGRERIEGLRNEIGKLNGKLEIATDAIALTNNQTLDAIRNEGREQTEGLRDEIGELNGKLEKSTDAIALTNNQTLDTIRNEEKERIEGLRHEIGELNGKLENATAAMALTNSQTLDTIRNEGRERIDGLRNELGELNEKFLNAKTTFL